MGRILAKQIKGLNDTIAMIEKEVRDNVQHPWSEDTCPLCKAFKKGRRSCGACPMKLVRLPSILSRLEHGAHCAKLRNYYDIGQYNVAYLGIFVDVLRCLKERLLKLIVY